MTRDPWFDALAQEVADSRAGQHEFNEAIRIADHWRHVNEDAGVLLTHIVNARESYLALARAADAAVRAASQLPEGDPVEVHPPDSRAESQAGSNGPSGSPTSPSGRVPTASHSQRSPE